MTRPTLEENTIIERRNGKKHNAEALNHERIIFRQKQEETIFGLISKLASDDGRSRRASMTLLDRTKATLAEEFLTER